MPGFSNLAMSLPAADSSLPFCSIQGNSLKIPIIEGNILIVDKEEFQNMSFKIEGLRI